MKRKEFKLYLEVAMRKILVICLVLMIGVLLFTACGSNSEITTQATVKDITDLYTLTQNDDGTYSYTLVDFAKNILFKNENVVRDPKINQVAVNVYELKTQTGTGLSTNWAVYCDVENSKTSEIFHYVLGAQNDCVVYADYYDGKHLITVQNIFDQSVYCKTYELENVSPVAADFALACNFDNDNKAIITYLTGDEFNETKITIDIP